jgi:cytosine/adenosine deaminase-related metal-dependent hydrolase
MLYRARIVVPVSAPPLEDGAVLVSGPRIVEVGRWADLRPRHPSQSVMDLGDGVLLPGLINAHCHLDYTGMAAKIPSPRTFSDFIKSILALKAAWSFADYAHSWVSGAKMLLRTGTTTVADIEAVPELLPEVWDTTPLKIISLLELTSVRSQRPPQDILSEAVDKITSLPEGNKSAGLSPHAPYSTTRELLQLAARCARSRQWPLAIHVAESLDEYDMFLYKSGPLYDWLKKQRNMDDCGKGSPLTYLAACGILGPNTLAIHANYLAPGDADLLARTNTSVVHCPRSHEYFRHRAFPAQELISAGVNLCLGTDSLATVRKPPRKLPELNLFAEMQTLAAPTHELAPETILRMATVNGARALGRAGQIGEFSRGAAADLIAVPIITDLAKVYEALVHHSGEISTVVLDGKIVPLPEPATPLVSFEI